MAESDELLKGPNPFYDNRDLLKLSGKTLAAEPFLEFIRDLRELELGGMRRFLWLRDNWMRKGIPVTLQNTKIVPLGRGKFRLEAEGTAENEASVPALPKGTVVTLMPAPAVLDEQLVTHFAPFYVVRGGVEALELSLGLPAHGEGQRKENRYIEIIRNQGEDFLSPREF